MRKRTRLGECGVVDDAGAVVFASFQPDGVPEVCVAEDGCADNRVLELSSGQDRVVEVCGE